jgi:phosphoribosylaminoimidazole carboxylase PurE protein
MNGGHPVKQVLILLGSKSDLPATEKGLSLLRELKITYSLRIASAHRTPAHVLKILDEFVAQGGQLCICVAGMAAHLGGVVAAHTMLPVIGVPIAQAATAGFDSLLSVSQMPPGIPVATMGFGSSGFTNASLLAGQILALHDRELAERNRAYRQRMTDEVIAADKEARIDFEG